MNVREDWPNRIWSPTNTGAWTRDLSLRRLTNVPWVLPASYRNISSPPSENWSTAWRRDEDGCSRTTSLSGVRPRARRLRPRQSTTSTMAPSLSTSREKSERKGGRPTRARRIRRRRAREGARRGDPPSRTVVARASRHPGARHGRRARRTGGAEAASPTSRPEPRGCARPRRSAGGRGHPHRVARRRARDLLAGEGNRAVPSSRQRHPKPITGDRAAAETDANFTDPCAVPTWHFTVQRSEGPRAPAHRPPRPRETRRPSGRRSPPPRGVDSDHAAPRHVRCRDALATSIVPERTSRLVVLTVPDRCRVSPSASSRRTPRPGAAWSAP